MEQRAEPRIAVESPVTIEVLGETRYTLEAELLDLSSRGMRLATRQPLAHDLALRIHLDQDLYLGEVVHCSPDLARYLIGISLFNVMRNAAQVSQRLNRILQPR